MTQHPDEFSSVGEVKELDRDLEPRRTWKIAPVTAVLAGVVLLATGITGGVVAHASLAGDNSTTAQQPGQRGGPGSYPGFGGRQPGANGDANGAATIGTVESVSGSTLKLKKQHGTEVTVTLTPDTDIQVTKQGAATDLTTGSTWRHRGRIRRCGDGPDGAAGRPVRRPPPDRHAERLTDRTWSGGGSGGVRRRRVRGSVRSS
jgi:hypothetical protein